MSKGYISVYAVMDTSAVCVGDKQRNCRSSVCAALQPGLKERYLRSAEQHATVYTLNLTPCSTTQGFIN